MSKLKMKRNCHLCEAEWVLDKAGARPEVRVIGHASVLPPIYFNTCPTIEQAFTLLL